MFAARGFPPQDEAKAHIGGSLLPRLDTHHNPPKQIDHQNLHRERCCRGAHRYEPTCFP